MKKAIVLLSGGLDSAVTLYLAKKQKFQCHCLTFNYHQRHRREIESARAIAHKAGCAIIIENISLPRKGSALLDTHLRIPRLHPQRERVSEYIPTTYVPARNIIFLSFALSFAETEKAKALFIGAHSEDYSGYPDCRPAFYRAFQRVIDCGTKAGVEHKGIKVVTPLLHKSKAEIIRLGSKLGVPFGLSWSCYRGGESPCGKCDSCYYRHKGFQEAGINDPLITR
ncbi:MAG: 7-cyano-7-deazaguanine synthase QueC [Candidatus Omnitrophica bacterium]|nr:7-cyano-7-deazaguanine synthase QueC [Candidatus Omnitrophota bacterium]MDD5592804.1 7-cyano-7-deazaguanine synthase QueC [Candidatus Omnitrophota bacterium]